MLLCPQKHLFSYFCIFLAFAAGGFSISDVFYSSFVYFLSVPIMFFVLFSAFALSGPPYLCDLPNFLHRSSCPLLAMGKNADYDRFLQLKARGVIFFVSEASFYICCPAVLVTCSYTVRRARYLKHTPDGSSTLVW